MAKVNVPNFGIHGMVSNQVQSRYDWPGRNNAFTLAQNVIISPRSGVSKRPGLRRIFDGEFARFFTWNKNDEERYIVCVKENGEVEVYSPTGTRQRVESIRGAGAATLGYSIAGRTNELFFRHIADVGIFCDGIHPPVVLRSTATGEVELEQYFFMDASQTNPAANRNETEFPLGITQDGSSTYTPALSGTITIDVSAIQDRTELVFRAPSNNNAVAEAIAIIPEFTSSDVPANFSVNETAVSGIASDGDRIYLTGDTTDALHSAEVFRNGIREDFTTVGNLNVSNMDDLAVWEKSDGTTHLFGCKGRQFYRINKETGVATAAFSTNFGGDPFRIAFNGNDLLIMRTNDNDLDVATATDWDERDSLPANIHVSGVLRTAGWRALAVLNGTIYGIDRDNNALHTISYTGGTPGGTTSGTTTRVGNSTNFGIGETDVRSMTAVGNRLFAVGRTNDALYNVNIATGEFTRTQEFNRGSQTVERMCVNASGNITRMDDMTDDNIDITIQVEDLLIGQGSFTPARLRAYALSGGRQDVSAVGILTRADTFTIGTLEIDFPPLIRVNDVSAQDRLLFADVSDDYKITTTEERIIRWAWNSSESRFTLQDFPIPQENGQNQRIGKPPGEYVMQWNADEDGNPIFGFPFTVSFRHGRLLFGGSPRYATRIWASRVGRPFDFLDERPGVDNAEDPTRVDIESDFALFRDLTSFSQIVDMQHAEELLVLTTSGEHRVSGVLNASDLTDQVVDQVGEYGSNRGVGTGRTNDLFFFENDGIAYSAFYDGSEFSYTISSISSDRNETIFSNLVWEQPAGRGQRRRNSIGIESAPYNVIRIAAGTPFLAAGSNLVIFLLEVGPGQQNECRIWNTLQKPNGKGFGAWSSWAFGNNINIIDVIENDNEFYFLSDDGVFFLDHTQFTDDVANGLYEVALESVNLSAPVQRAGETGWYSPKKYDRVYADVPVQGNLMFTFIYGSSGTARDQTKSLPPPAPDGAHGLNQFNIIKRHRVDIDQRSDSDPFSNTDIVRWRFTQNDDRPLVINSIETVLDVEDKKP